MKLPRRRFLHLATGAAALPVVPRIARAQSYPMRPVRWIVGFPPGGGADTVTRILGQWLSERLRQQVIIENRPGASTNIAAQAVIKGLAYPTIKSKLADVGTIPMIFTAREFGAYIAVESEKWAKVIRVANIMPE